MKYKSGRRIVLIGLILLLIALILFYTKYTNSNSDEYSETEVEDDSVVDNKNILFIIDDHTFLVEGTGVLERYDLKKLFKQNGIEENNINNLIIGDGYTQLGYNCINGYEELEYLKIGESVKRVRNGGVKNLPKLKFVYIPSSIDKIGLDFLYGSDECVILTDEDDSNNFLELYGFIDRSVFYGVHSIEDVLGKELAAFRFHIDAESLAIDGENYVPSFGNNPIILYSGQRQYGPWIELHKNRYLVEICGKNLDNLSEGCITAGKYMEPEGYTRGEASIEADRITYCLDLENDISNFEFNITNYSEATIEIDGINIYVYTVVPDELSKW